HSHPSGESSPSEADIKLTKKLAEVGALLDIRVFGRCAEVALRKASLLTRWKQAAAGRPQQPGWVGKKLAVVFTHQQHQAGSASLCCQVGSHRVVADE
ncbi:MAG: hypothetical protein EOO62_04100, partial [Hymenobacter sp.]